MKTAFLLALLCSCSAPQWSDSWGERSDGAWAGKEWYQNRIQDWRIQGGRLECLHNSNALAGRTTHLLTRTFDGDSQSGSIHVRIEPLDDGNLRAGSCAGLLFGMGGEDIDYRATAIVQQVPAPGGGWLAIIDAEGELSIRDFSTSINRSGSWVLPRNVDHTSLPVLARARSKIAANTWPLELNLSWNGQSLIFSISHEGRQLSSLRMDDLAENPLTGSMSMFSARGPVGSSKGFAFSNVRLRGAKHKPERAFGPILGVLYLDATDTNGQSCLRLVAQLPWLGTTTSPPLKLRLGNAKPIAGNWQDDGSWTVLFEVADWSSTKDTSYQLLWSGEVCYRGTIRAADANQDSSLALLSCVKNQVGPIQWNAQGLWFPHADLSERVLAQDPDLLFFAGDQIYEGDITGPDRSSLQASIMDYHTKWQRFLWAFGDLTRDRPAITLPDDHDVFHGNLWGSGGVRAKAGKGLSEQDSGGYKMPAKFVNAVHATLLRQLPPSRLSPRIGQGISTYSTTFSRAGIDYCVLADRMWKDSASAVAPAGKIVNGWSQLDDFDPRMIDVPGASLLGVEQEAMLAAWSLHQTPGTWTRLVLSQSPFSCLHSLPGKPKSDSMVPSLKIPGPLDYPSNDHPTSDTDSNGWPQTARNRAVGLLAQAGALHLCGDQHLGTVAWYGTEHHRDGTIAFTGPAMANTFPRRWMPSTPGANPAIGAPRYTGDYLDGFGNLVTVLAAANPVVTGREPALLYDRAPGWGLIKLSPKEQSLELEAWPRWADIADSTQQFPGWPIRLNATGQPQ